MRLVIIARQGICFSHIGRARVDGDLQSLRRVANLDISNVDVVAAQRLNIHDAIYKQTSACGSPFTNARKGIRTIVKE